MKTSNVDVTVIFLSKAIEEVEAKGTAEFGNSNIDHGLEPALSALQIDEINLQKESAHIPQKALFPPAMPQHARPL